MLVWGGVLVVQEEQDLECQYRELKERHETEQRVHGQLINYLRNQHKVHTLPPPPPGTWRLLTPVLVLLLWIQELSERVESWESKMAEDVGRLDSLHASLTQVQHTERNLDMSVSTSLFTCTR
jgi:hypothetical protein